MLILILEQPQYKFKTTKTAAYIDDFWELAMSNMDYCYQGIRDCY